MKVNYELNLSTFKAWSGAVDTLDRIQREGKCEELESILEDIYPDGMTETELNDLLWFEPDTVYEWLGMRTESDIQSEIDEAEERIVEIEEELEELMNDYAENESDIVKLEAEKFELKEIIAELKEELEEI